MPKITVDGKEVEYSEEELFDAIDILRQDRVLGEFKSMREQQKAIVEWMNEYKVGKRNDGDSGDGGSGNSGSGDAGHPKSDDGSGDVGNGDQNPGGPTPPPALTDAEKEQQKPQPKRSRWWGDAISYDDDK